MSTTTVSGLHDSTPLSGPSTASSDVKTEFYTTSTIVDAVNEFISTAPPASISKTPLTQEHLTATPTMSTMFGAPTSSLTPHKVNVADLSHSLQHFGFVDYVVFVLMLVVCAVIGFYFGFIEKKKKKGKRGNEERRGSEALDYLVGGRKMKVFPVSLSLVASFISGISLLGTSTEIYVYGTQYAFILLTLVISGVISWYIFLPVFCNLQLTSTYEYFEMRFDRTIRMMGSILFTLGTLLWLPIVIYVPALAFNQVTGIDTHVITPIVSIVCIFYTCVGGLKAVIWTDVLQTLVMIGAIIFVIIKGTLEVGGFGVVWERNAASGRVEAPTMTLDPTIRISMLSMVLGGTLHNLLTTAGNQHITQRFLSLPGLKEAKRALIYFILGVMAFTLSTCYNGMLIHATYYDCDPLTTRLAKSGDQLVPLLVMDVLGFIPGLPGVFVAGVFSAALSSLSTGLNSLSAIVLEDFVKPTRKFPLTERQTAFIMRFSVVTIGILCVSLVYVVEHLGAVIQINMTFGSIVNGPLLSLFLMGFLMPWINAKSALFGCITSLVVTTLIIVKIQLAIALGEFAYPTKPVSIDGCEYSFEALNTTSTIPVYTGAESFWHYFTRITFFLYIFVGSSLTIIFSCLASLYFGRNDPRKVNPDLLAPITRRLLGNHDYSNVACSEMKQSIPMNFEIETKIT